MKSHSFEAIKQIISDRYLTVLVGVLLLLTIAYCIWIGVTVRPTELQVVNHYTAFGITNFYRNQWYYLLSFIGFGIIVALAHTLLAAKLYSIANRTFALACVWLGIAILIIAWVLTNSILQVASLS